MSEHLTHLPYHYAKAEKWQDLFDLLDHTPFLLWKTEYYGKFSNSSQDIEDFAIPAAILCSDWFHYVYYSILTINLHGLLLSLNDEHILQALVENQQFDLALDVASLDTDSLTASRFKAAIASHPAVDEVLRNRLIREIIDDLYTTADKHDILNSSSLFDTMMVIANHLGPLFKSRLMPLLKGMQVGAEQKDQLWITVATCCMEKHGQPLQDLWWALREVQSASTLAENMPKLLSLAKGIDFSDTLNRIVEHLKEKDIDAYFLAIAAILSRIAEFEPDTAWYHWKQIAPKISSSCSPQLPEIGKRFFASLNSDQMSEIEHSIQDVVTKAALHITILEKKFHEEVAEKTIDAIEQISPDDVKLYWLLRFLSVLEESQLRCRKHLFSIVIRYTIHKNYDVGKESLSLFFNILAQVFPEKIPDIMDCAIWNSKMESTTLLFLAEKSTSEALLMHLIQYAGRYSAIVTHTETQGFALRKKLLITLCKKLCLSRQDLFYLEKVEKQLLPGEQDELYIETALVLDSRGLSDLAHKVYKRIRSRKSQLIIGLKLKRDAISSGTDFDLPQLYEYLVDFGFIQNELHRLSALCEIPNTPEILNEKYLSSLTDPADLVEALVDLARHAISYQEIYFDAPQRDFKPALGILRQAVKIRITESHRLFLTPEVLELTAKAGGAKAIPEFQEGIYRVITLESANWEDRVAVLHEILGQMEPLFLFKEILRSNQWSTYSKGLAELFLSFINFEDKDHKRDKFPRIKFVKVPHDNSISLTSYQTESAWTP